MYDPLDLIKKDHETMEALFKECEDLQDESGAKKMLLRTLTAVLLVHTEMEETICYPQFKEALKEEDHSLLEEAYLAHQEMRGTLQHLGSLEETGIEFEEGMISLIEQVRHHVQEEEQHILPKVKQEVPQEVLNAMGDDLMSFMESRGSMTS